MFKYRILLHVPTTGWKTPSLVDRRIILRWIFRKWVVGVWTGMSWFRIGTGGGYL